MTNNQSKKTAAHMTAEELIEQARPKPTSDQERSVKLIAKIRDKKNAEREADRERRDSSALYYLECRTCQMPALFFVRDPGLGSVISHEEWFSQLKPAGRPWHAGKLRCQECGQRAPANYTQDRQRFVPNARYIRSITPDDEDAKALIDQMQTIRRNISAEAKS